MSKPEEPNQNGGGADERDSVRCSRLLCEGAAPGYEEEAERDEEGEDERPLDDWCRTQGWNDMRDCPVCGGSGQYDDCTPCWECDGDGILDR